jgi:predicted nucleic acid-binding Zn ribbon protein
VNVSPRRERQLGFVTQNGQRFPQPGVGERDAVAALKSGFCPWCGAGPFTVPLQHINVKHGLDQYQLRDALGLRHDEVLCDPTHSALKRQQTTELGLIQNLTPTLGRPRVVRKRLKPARKPPAAHLCVVCGTTLSGKRKTCSTECLKSLLAMRARESGFAQPASVVITFECPVCGESVTKRENDPTRYCSESCAGRARAAREGRTGGTFSFGQGVSRAGTPSPLKGRPKPRQSHCKRGHLLDDANTKIIGGVRRCAACVNERDRKRRLGLGL